MTAIQAPRPVADAVVKVYAPKPTTDRPRSFTTAIAVGDARPARAATSLDAVISAAQSFARKAKEPVAVLTVGAGWQLAKPVLWPSGAILPVRGGSASSDDGRQISLHNIDPALQAIVGPKLVYTRGEDGTIEIDNRTVGTVAKDAGRFIARHAAAGYRRLKESHADQAASTSAA